MALIDWQNSSLFTGNFDEDEGKEMKRGKDEEKDRCANKSPRDDAVMPEEETQSSAGLTIGK